MASINRVWKKLWKRKGKRKEKDKKNRNGEAWLNNMFSVPKTRSVVVVIVKAYHIRNIKRIIKLFAFKHTVNPFIGEK